MRQDMLSDQDLADLRNSYRDLSDIDSQTIARALEGFRRSYDIAQRIVDGTLDPLSA